MQSEEKDFLLKKVDHLISVLNKSGVTQFFGFLSEEDFDFLSSYLTKRKISFGKYGGIEGSERNFLSIYDDYPPEKYEYPISVIKIELAKNAKEQSHRNYLGSMLGLGIERRVIGDIVVDGNSAFVSVNYDFVNFFKTELTKISNESCIISEVEDASTIERKTEFKEITISVASNRLDAIVSELTNLSRDNAKDLILKGLVSVNGEEVLSPVKEIKPDSKISVRKFGKFIFVAEQGNTKSGRLRLTFKKYM